MLLTSTDNATKSSEIGSVAEGGTCPDSLVRAVRADVRQGLDWQRTAECVAGTLRDRLPDPAAILSARLRRGDPACYQSHLLYAEPDGSFSIAAMVWLPGQETVIHDHVAWCVTGVLQGREYEEVFALAPSKSEALGVRLFRRRYDITDNAEWLDRAIYLATVLADTLNPNLANSAWIHF